MSYTASIALAILVDRIHSIPISCAILVFVYLHRRNKKKQALEDINDPHKSLDFGLGMDGPHPNIQRPKRGLRGKRNAPEMIVTEMGQDDIRKQTRGLSMDMLGSPYMLPSGVSGSHDSLQSMSRSMRDEHDPYRPVVFPRGSTDTSRSPRPFNDKASMYSASTTYTGFNDKSTLVVNAQRMSQSYLGPLGHHSRPETRSGDDAPLPALPNDALVLTRSHESSPLSAEPQVPDSSVTESDSLRRKPIPISKDEPKEFNSFSLPQELPADSQHASELPTVSNHPSELPTDSRHPPRTSSVYVAGPPARKSSLAVDAVMSADRPTSDMSYYGENPLPSPAKDPEPEAIVPPAPEYHAVIENYETQEEDLGYDIDPSMIYTGRHSIDGGVPNEEDYPLEDNRMSYMGMRPLPPDHPEENPEQRANRIRSFYKEYFDANRVTQAPAEHYYEDYDAGYADYYYGDGWYDPSTGAYYEPPQAPYAQPVGRRAMTPPPRSGPRFAGAHDRHFSTMSGGGRGPHAFRGRPPPKKKLPPPKALTSLPTPHMLKSDSALLTSIDFAPPTSFREIQNGRGRDSPTGTRRPFSPGVRAYSPLVSPYETLSPMPSPHQLRKSGTFTSLDFSPQVPRFLGRDTGSDAGSIRSARSGMSALQERAVRSGAYRVSRIPKEFVTSRDDLTRQLKPKMDLTTPA